MNIESFNTNIVSFLPWVSFLILIHVSFSYRACASQLSITVTKHPRWPTYKERRFVLTHSCGASVHGFWTCGDAVDHGRSKAAYPMAAGKQREKKVRVPSKECSRKDPTSSQQCQVVSTCASGGHFRSNSTVEVCILFLNSFSSMLF
jgi:hypothetical protein